MFRLIVCTAALFIVALPCAGTVFAERIIGLVPLDERAIPEAMLSVYRDLMDAIENEDGERTLGLYALLAENQELPMDVRTHAMAQRVIQYEISNRYVEALEVLEAIKTLRNDASGERIRFYCDLEIARAMVDTGGALPDFDPSLEETRKQFEHIFQAYSYQDSDAVRIRLKGINYYAIQASQSSEYRQLTISLCEETIRLIREIQALPDRNSDEQAKARRNKWAENLLDGLRREISLQERASADTESALPIQPERPEVPRASTP